jgi:hypothetical protein
MTVGGVHLAHAGRRPDLPMRMSISFTLLLGLAVFFLVRKDDLKITHALVAVLLGFFLAATAVASGIGRLSAMIATMLGGSLNHP